VVQYDLNNVTTAANAMMMKGMGPERFQPGCYRYDYEKIGCGE
jgi:hypothetical protein